MSPDIVIAWVLLSGPTVATLVQLARTIRTRDVSGVALSTHAVWTLTWALVLVDVARLEAWAGFGVRSIAFVADATLLEVLAWASVRAGTTVAALVGSTWFPATVAAALLFLHSIDDGRYFFVFGVALFSALATLPQLWLALRAGSLRGLSLISWEIRLASAAGWVLVVFWNENYEPAWWELVVPTMAAGVCLCILLDRRKVRRAHSREQHAEGTRQIG